MHWEELCVNMVYAKTFKNHACAANILKRCIK